MYSINPYLILSLIGSFLSGIAIKYILDTCNLNKTNNENDVVKIDYNKLLFNNDVYIRLLDNNTDNTSETIDNKINIINEEHYPTVISIQSEDEKSIDENSTESSDSEILTDEITEESILTELSSDNDSASSDTLSYTKQKYTISCEDIRKAFKSSI